MRFSVVAALSLVSAALAQSALIVNTPTSLIECQPYAVTWSGGQSPYFISVLPGGQLSATAITTLGVQPTTATSYTWTVNIASGTSVTLKVLDSAGNPAYSAQVTIQPGSSTACLAASTTTGAAGSASSSGAVASSATSAAVASSTAVSSASAATSSATTSAAAAATTSRAATTAAVATTASAAAAATSSRAASGASLVGFSSTLLGVVGAAFLAIGA